MNLDTTPACTPTGRATGDGRDYLACGSITNPAGFCCDHGVDVVALDVPYATGQIRHTIASIIDAVTCLPGGSDHDPDLDRAINALIAAQRALRTYASPDNLHTRG